MDPRFIGGRAWTLTDNIFWTFSGDEPDDVDSLINLNHQ